MAALSIKDEKNVVALLNPEKSYGFIDLHALHPQLTTTVPVILYRESKTAALNKVSAVRTGALPRMERRLLQLRRILERPHPRTGYCESSSAKTQYASSGVGRTKCRREGTTQRTPHLESAADREFVPRF